MIARRRTACIATFANRPSRTCVSSAITTRVPPYAMVSSTGAAKIQASAGGAAVGACGSPLSASTAHLNENGTAIVAILAASSSTVAHTTRIFRSARSDGQIYGHRYASVVSNAPRSAEIGFCERKLAGACGAFILKSLPKRDANVRIGPLELI